jgi:hypothetical protein
MTNYKVRELLSRVKTVKCDHTLTYSAILQLRAPDPERQVRMLMADKVAHAIAGDILNGGLWSKRHEPEGEVFSVRGHWLTYEQLYLLVEEAYSMGRTEPVALTLPSAP